MVVDHQWHWLSPDQLDLLKQRTSPPRVDIADGQLVFEMDAGLVIPVPATHAAALDDHMQVAADHGIDAVVSSPTLFGEVLHLDPSEAAELLELNNTIMADAQRRHPGRFFGLALLPLQDADAALR